MGYKTYIGSMPKREYNKIKSMSREQLIEHYKLEAEEDENYLGMGVYDFGESLYEFGKYTDFEPPKKSLKTFFKNKELNEYFTEQHDFNIVTPEFLEYLIELYRKRIRAYYNEMLTPFFGARCNKSEFMSSVNQTDFFPDKYEFDFSKITPEEQTQLYKILYHVRDFRTEWVSLNTFNLKQGDSITTSWKYEYGIFELVRIYKSFDWKRNVMIYYGY